ncbi:MAG: hypothetical protein PHX68_01255 [Alphaproteobacteria bacterium]|nr:hypothetical protein [Alphaproteobacteria bacterium]
MKKYAKIHDAQTRVCEVFIGTDTAWAIARGFAEMDVEQAPAGDWYAAGYAPPTPEKTYAEKRAAAYPSVTDQLDMMYWDKVNGTDDWRDAVAAVKAAYPKA